MLGRGVSAANGERKKGNPLEPDRRQLFRQPARERKRARRGDRSILSGSERRTTLSREIRRATETNGEIDVPTPQRKRNSLTDLIGLFPRQPIVPFSSGDKSTGQPLNVNSATASAKKNSNDLSAAQPSVRAKQTRRRTIHRVHASGSSKSALTEPGNSDHFKAADSEITGVCIVIGRRGGG